MYKNCDLQEKKYGAASKVALEAAKEQKILSEVASIVLQKKTKKCHHQ